MSSYIIAGSADNSETAKCEYLADAIQAINPKVDIRTIIKHAQDWDNYINDICRTYGFKHKDNPIIFQTNGQLIGNADDFCLFAEQNFGISQDLIDTKQRNEIINIKQAQKQFVKTTKQRNRKRTLKEKIHDKLYDLLENQTIQQIMPNYQEIKENGLLFYTKREQKMQVEYPLQLIQEPPLINKNVQEQQVEINLEEMYKKDYYENPEDALKNMKQEEEEQQQQGTTGGKKKKQKGQEKEKEKEKEIVQEVVVEEKKEEVIENPEEIKQEGEQQLDIEGQLEIENEEQKQDEQLEQALLEQQKEVIDIQPDRILMNDFIIKKLKDNYYIALHPNPIINGQCILFEDIGPKEENNHLQQENQEIESNNIINNNNDIYLADYSSIGRLRKQRILLEKKPNTNPNSNVVSMELKHTYKSNLNNCVLNLFNPLSQLDLDKCCNVLKLLNDGYIIYQLLPGNGQTPFNLISNVIHVFEKNALNKARFNKTYFSEIDEKFIKHLELPFEKYIMSEQMENIQFEYQKETKDKKLKDVKVVFQQNCLLPKPHLIANHNQTGKNIQKIIFQIILYFKGSLNYCISQTGYTILLTQKKIYLGLLQSPIQIPPPFQLYLPPLSVLGFLHYPIAGQFKYEGKSFEILQNQMNNNNKNIQLKTEQEIEEQKLKLPQVKYQTQIKDRENQLKEMLNTFPKEEKPKFQVKDVVVM